MAVQEGLLHTTASPVCTALGPVRVLNLTARMLVSARLAFRRRAPPTGGRGGKAVKITKSTYIILSLYSI